MALVVLVLLESIATCVADVVNKDDRVVSAVDTVPIVEVGLILLVEELCDDVDLNN